jgi:hypothetical protein
MAATNVQEATMQRINRLVAGLRRRRFSAGAMTLRMRYAS